MTLKRYDIYANNPVIERHKSNEVEHSDGEWVKYSDYEAEIAALRAKVRELEERVPRWVWDAEDEPLRAAGWKCLGSKWVGARTAHIMVPPIPVPGEER